MHRESEQDQRFVAALQLAAGAARGFLAWMEDAAERLAPDRLAAIATETRERHGEPLAAARAALLASPPGEPMRRFAERFDTGFTAVERAFAAFAGAPDAGFATRIPQLLDGMHQLALANEVLYSLREPLPPLHGFWDLPGEEVVDARAFPGSDKQPPTGVVHVSKGGDHGGFSLYVPETYGIDRPWPVIVALHGGSGSGRDFLWTWVREARSRGYIVLSPKSLADTWSEQDDRGLLQILTWLGRNYRIDEHRLLLTGLSDGATFALLYGLAHPTVYRAIAPLCGVLHPANQLVGNLDRARGVPVYLVHGALDFLFPVVMARAARDTLESAGAALTYREIAGLSHTYPRSENVAILDWFESLPPPGPTA